MIWFLIYKNHLCGPLEIYGYLITCLMLCTVTKSDSHGSGTRRFRPHEPVNSMDLDSHKQVDDIKTVGIEMIRKEVNGCTFNRQLHFASFGIIFRILLRRHLLFDKNIHLTVDDEVLGVGVMKLTRYLPVMYVGIIENSPNSVVHGRVTDTEFAIFFEKGNDTYSVECPFNEIKEAKTKYGNLRHSLKNCQASKLLKPKMSKLVHLDNRFDSISTDYKDFIAIAMPVNVVNDNPYLLKRAKRSSPSQVTGNCVLKLVADHSYFEKAGNSDVRKTVGKMVGSLATTDSIFRQTDFNGDGAGDNHGFIVGNITIFRSSHEYLMKDEKLTVEQYLRKLSEYDFSSYCVGVGFTHRTFSDGVVGLAWLGSSNDGIVGGMCQGLVRDGSKYVSFNTAIVTHINSGQFLSTYTVGLILAHELGHSFGSSHDTEKNPECTPGGNFGNYLMYPVLSFRGLANNDRFSPCSTSAVYPVIVKRGPGCFVEDLAAVCGNGIVEGEEECDCGTVEMCHEIDPCCTPVNTSTSDVPCTISVSSGHQCSPITSPCCSPTCHFYNATDHVMCQERTECSEEQFCEFGSSTCPDVTPLPDETLCDSGRKICSNGMCSLSICSKLNLVECQCTSSMSTACYICCMTSNTSSYGCSPINTFSITLHNVLKRNADPCFNYQGFCDENGECILQPTDMMDGLNNFMSMQTVVNLRIWLKKYWFYVVIGILSMIFLVMIITVFFKTKPDLKTDALRMGKLSALFAQAGAQKQIYRKKIEECERVYENFIQQVNNQECQIPLTKAVARLAMLFPTAPMSVLTTCVKTSSTEEFAVKMMLLRNFPMQTFSVTLVGDTPVRNRKHNYSGSQTVL